MLVKSYLNYLCFAKSNFNQANKVQYTVHNTNQSTSPSIQTIQFHLFNYRVMKVILMAIPKNQSDLIVVLTSVGCLLHLFFRHKGGCATEVFDLFRLAIYCMAINDS